MTSWMPSEATLTAGSNSKKSHASEYYDGGELRTLQASQKLLFPFGSSPRFHVDVQVSDGCLFYLC